MKNKYIDRAAMAPAIVTCMASIFMAAPCISAEPAPQEGASSQDIVVTARRRSEAILDAPVSVTALGQAALTDRALVSVTDLTNFVPSIQLQASGNTAQGGLVSIRGLGGPQLNPLSDQPVTFVVDGVPIAYSSVLQAALIDLDHVEVIKGPQSLLYGKNSPAGVIVFATADPTSTFKAGGSLGYEGVGEELRGEAYISGPLTDTLGARLAVYGSHMNGWQKNIGPSSPPFATKDRSLPNVDEFAARLTLAFKPSTDLHARMKLTYSRKSGDTSTDQYVDCPTGAPQTGAIDECRANNKIYRAGLGTTFLAVEPRLGPQPFFKSEQILGSVQIVYDLNNHVSLESTSGLYHVLNDQYGNYGNTDVPGLIIPGRITFNPTIFSQELRLSSKFDGPLNFMTGAIYSDSTVKTRNNSMFNALAPFLFNNYLATQKGEAYSFFGQLSWQVLPMLELSGGARYSHETKRLRRSTRSVPVPNSEQRGSWSNVSPQATLSWKPNANLNLYASYNTGFLSGGFSPDAGPPTSDLSYNQTKIKGGEIGIKGRLLDGAMNVNLAIFDYDISGLQVQTQVTTASGFSTRISNAGKSNTKGVEFDLSWSTPIEGLKLNGSLAYNKARYKVYTASCYVGQTVLDGCNLAPVGGVFSVQNLAGEQIVLSPDLKANIGFDYAAPISATLRASVGVDTSYSDSFFTSANAAPGSLQKAFWQVNSVIKIGAIDNAWDISLIGRNLTDAHPVLNAYENPFSGGGTGTAAGIRADTIGTLARGRQLWVRVSFHL